MLRNTGNSWGSMAKLLHWSMAVLLLAQIVLGILAVSWSLSPVKLNLFIWHKSLGMVLLLLVALRLLWRTLNTRPGLPAKMPGWQIVASRISHGLLYVLMVALPLSGWGLSSASGVPFKVFWLFPLPEILEPDKAMAALMEFIHRGLVVALVAVLLIHISAALYHHMVRHDQVLRRMLPGKHKQ